MVIGNGFGQTLHGDSPLGSYWQTMLAQTKSVSTDGGIHPQNVFRLFTKDVWKNSTQQVQVRVDATQLSNSSSRKASNGIFLINRYDHTADSYYVAGIRVDGHVVIKKKLDGKYYSLSYEPLFENGSLYDRTQNPNLILTQSWMSLKTIIETKADGKVTIALYHDLNNSNQWKLVGYATDDGVSTGPTIEQPGYAGIWTDFMDISFDNYRLKENASLVLEPGLTIAYEPIIVPAPLPLPTTARQLFETFSPDGLVEETGSMASTLDENFWLNSGAYLYRDGGIGRTIFGELPIGSKWQIAFNNYNAPSTDGGVHPQNIFRLFTVSEWQDQQQQMLFNIDRINESIGSHRNASNGVLLFSRYANEDNLYYAGIRVDGKAVVKKKIRGRYYTLAIDRVYPGSYNRDTNSNLIPTQRWIGLRSTTTNLSNGRVQIEVFMDLMNNGTWTSVLTAIDDGVSFGGVAFTEEGHSGIRTDFMDISFDDYRVLEI